MIMRPDAHLEALKDGPHETSGGGHRSKGCLCLNWVHTLRTATQIGGIPVVRLQIEVPTNEAEQSSGTLLIDIKFSARMDALRGLLQRT